MKIIQNILLLILCCAICIQAHAQTQILQKTIDKIAACKSISYNAESKSKNPFSDDIYNLKITASFAGSGRLYNIYTNTRDSSNFNYTIKNIYNSKDLLSLNFTDNTYTIKNNYTEPFFADYSIYTLSDRLKGIMRVNNFVISQLADSIVNNISCFHIFIKTPDSVAKKTGSYTRQDILIRKDNYLPAYFKENSQGVAEKGGMKIGTIKMSSATYFTGYRLNAEIPGRFALKIPKGFKAEKPPLAILTKGTIAPDWKLTSSNGGVLSMADLKGKVTLLDITSTSCAACMLSVPPLNKLHEKYKGTDVAIVSINLDDTRKTLLKFINKNHIEYPVYINGNSIKSAYHVSAIPTFYIIDKQGVISESYDGYFENFEEEMTSKIDKLR